MLCPMPYDVDAFLEHGVWFGYRVDTVLQRHVKGALPREDLPWSINYAVPKEDRYSYLR